MIKKENLDKRICDVEEGATNQETLRQYIRATEVEFCVAERDIDSMNDEELLNYVNYLDELWNK